MAQRGKIGRGKVTVEDLFLQASMAFGQGAVDMNVTPRASKLIHAYFTKRFEHHIEHYQDHRLGILAYARGLGWYAATLANSKGRALIDAPELRVAIDKFPCPFMPEILDFLDQLGRRGRIG